MSPVLKKRVGNLHRALEIQLEYNRAVENHIDRLDERREVKS